MTQGTKIHMADKAQAPLPGLIRDDLLERLPHLLADQDQKRLSIKNATRAVEGVL